MVVCFAEIVVANTLS